MDPDRTIGSTGTDGVRGAPDLGEAGLLAPGEVVDRYLLLGKLGAGGMGVVYAAFDPELDRKVALKLLLPQAGGDRGAVARARLLREAQALARLSHRRGPRRCGGPCGRAGSPRPQAGQRDDRP